MLLVISCTIFNANLILTYFRICFLLIFSVWNDIRTDVTVDKILAKLPDQNKNYFKSISGLPISPYFSALKLRWLKDNVVGVRKAYRERRCLAGTIDSWLVWNLTGGKNGGLHVTDVTNASRTLLMNIETLNWDPVSNFEKILKKINGRYT